MKTILLNGSPKGNAQNSASYLLAKAFAAGMRQPGDIHSISKENPKELLALLPRFDHILIFLPNYIHAVPGSTLDFLYTLPVCEGTQSLGFIIQSGFPEGSENELISRFFKNLSARLNYTYLGTVVKGECAGLGLMPGMYKKLTKQFTEFGALYDQTGYFDQEYCKKFASPYTLSRSQVWIMNATSPLGNCLGWNRILKANNAYHKRLATPYLE